MNRPTLLIGGGYDKQSTYEEWIQAFDGKVRFLVLIGDTKEKIAKAARNVGFNDIIMADNLKEAVQTRDTTRQMQGMRFFFPRPAQAGISLRAMSSAVSCLRST